jgi:hypothetical protein
MGPRHGGPIVDREALTIAAGVARVLDRLGIAYLLGGSAASSHFGVPRSTNDIDLVADVRADDVDALVEALTEEFYIEPDSVAEAVARGTSFSVIHWERVLKVDIFITGDSPFPTEQLRRATLESVAGLNFRVASPEDIVLAKLRWFRDGGEASDRQWEDVCSVLSIQADRLDLDYMRHWAADLGIADLLEQALVASQS